MADVNRISMRCTSAQCTNDPGLGVGSAQYVYFVVPPHLCTEFSSAAVQQHVKVY